MWVSGGGCGTPPLFFVDGSFQATLRDELGFGLGLGFWTLSTIVFSIGFTWLFNSTRGNSLAASVLHGAVNTWISWGLADANSLESLAMFAWFVGLWVAVAAFLVLVNGSKTLTSSGRRIIGYVDRSAAADT